MNFLSSNSPPIFLTKQEELDYLVWKERMRKLEKRQNEFASKIADSKVLSFKLMDWLSKRRLFCEKCNNQFYSNEGYVSHGCFR